jgi:leucyl-tRNA synthetase
MVHAQSWPSFDAALARSERVTMVVQVNGKVRDRIEVSPDITEEAAVAIAAASERVSGALGGAQPARVVARPPRLVNFVT